MALEYALYLASTDTREELLARLLSSSVGFQRRETLAVAPGVSLTLPRPISPGMRSTLEISYGLACDLALVFDVDKAELWTQGIGNMIALTLELLRAPGAEGILFFNWEAPILLSQRGALTLNSDSGFWDAQERLDLIDQPFQTGVVNPF